MACGCFADECPDASAIDAPTLRSGAMRDGADRHDAEGSLLCEVCGATSRLVLTQTRERRLDFYLCRGCGLLFAGTDVPDEELAQAYQSIDTASYYDKIGPTSKAKAAHAVGDLKRLAGDHARVVDLGCGGGHLLREIAEQTGWDAVGYDLDEACVERCRAQGMRATADLAELPTAADIVTMLDLAEHVKDPKGLFDEAARLAGPRGLLYLHTPRRCLWDTVALHLLRVGLLRPIGEAWLRPRVSIFHLRLWSDAALDIMTRAAGFQVVAYRRELELSWPLAMYAEFHLGEKLGAPPVVVRTATAVAHVVASCRLMRNKAVLSARRESGIG